MSKLKNFLSKLFSKIAVEVGGLILSILIGLLIISPAYPIGAVMVYFDYTLGTAEANKFNLIMANGIVGYVFLMVVISINVFAIKSYRKVKEMWENS